MLTLTTFRRSPTARVLLTALGLLGTAHAHVLHLPVTVPVAALLQPEAHALHAACDTGFALALAGEAPPTVLDGVPTQYTLSSAQMPTVTLTTALGSMVSTCHRGSMDSRASAAARTVTTGMVWVSVRGETQTGLRDEAQGWAVNLSVLDSAGREVARLEPSRVAAGRPELWRSSCQHAVCVWMGENRYGFDLGQLSAGVKAALGHAAQVMVNVDLPVPTVLATRP